MMCPNCDSKPYCRGFCKNCYQNERRNGSLLKLTRVACKHLDCVKETRGLSGYCKEHYKAIWQQKNKDVINPRNTSRKHNLCYRYSQLKSSAKKRGLELDLSIEDHAKLLENPCFYCGKDLKNEKGSSLDRIDNNEGYNNLNVLPCCKVCNMSRGNFYNVEEFKVMVDALNLFRVNKTKKIG